MRSTGESGGGSDSDETNMYPLCRPERARKERSSKCQTRRSAKGAEESTLKGQNGLLALVKSLVELSLH